ncbi:Hha/YmoA family nucleoid-associated regulatory protein [Escherichia coli]
MNKLDFLLKFRRSSSDETLEKVVEHMEPKVSKEDYNAFQAAADHRRAELACKKIFDKVPKSAWKFVK